MSQATDGPTIGHLGCLVPDRAVDRGVEVVGAAHAAEVDQLDAVADLDEVVRLEVAVDQPEVVEVLERRQHLDDERDRLVDRQRVVPAARRSHPVLEQLLERGAADVLHDDVAVALVRHEVVDLDDERVLDLGEELPLGDGRGEGVGVAGVEQALEHHPAVGHVAVAGDVDPAQAAVGDGPGDHVLAADHVARLQLGREGERGAALGAEALGAPRLAVAGTAHRRPAVGQLRRSSGTIGFFSTALAASTAGTGGMDVRPAPRRAPRRRVDDVPTRRVTLLPPRRRARRSECGRREPVGGPRHGRRRLGDAGR